MALFNNPEFTWFGTEEKMGWIITPNTGADVSSAGNNSTVVLQNGGAASRQSWDSAKRFQFSWGETANHLMVSLLQAYRNGSYGRGLIWFHDPMHYETNLLPKRWADPSMAVNQEGEPLLPDTFPSSTPVTATENNYPVRSADYTLPASFSSETAGLEQFIPIPQGMSLVVGASYTGTGQVYLRGPGVDVVLPQLPLNGPVATTVVNGPWVRLGLRNPTAAPVQISLVGLTARLSAPAESGGNPGATGAGPWYSGEGHSGCRFDGDPTIINYNGVDGGQMGLSANFVEVGAWA